LKHLFSYPNFILITLNPNFLTSTALSNGFEFVNKQQIFDKFYTIVDNKCDS